MARPRIMYYHDGRHPHIYRYEPPMTKAEYQACIDELVGTPVEAVMFCLGEGRTVLHDTQVGELLGHNVEQWDHVVFRRAYENAKHLIDEGDDPLQIVCERAQEKDLLLYPTLLVQNGGDTHAHIRNSNFRINNQHLEIGAGGDLPPDLHGIDGLDFKHEEVRNERFNLIEETVKKYSVAGFELQMTNTFPLFFHPDEVEEGRAIMTQWIGRVYEVVKDSGAERELVIRLPRTRQWCHYGGLDPEEWIRQGIVDVLAPEPITGPHRLDPNLDFTPFLKAAVGTNTRILGVLHARVANDRIGDGPIEMMRAAACNYWEQGVDGLYVAQWFQQWPYTGQFYEKLRELPHPDIMAAKDKYYYVPTEIDTPWNPLTPTQLPIDMSLHNPAAAHFVISDDLQHWGKRERIHEVMLRVGISNITEIDNVRFSLNDTELPTGSMRRINQAYRMNAPRNRTGPTYWFVFRLESEFWPVKGQNILTATVIERDEHLLGDVRLRDVELEIKYLMGKSFHREYVDPDLGHYEHSGM